MSAIAAVDRSTMIARLHAQLVLDRRSTAIVAIDMHRGHLDREVATMRWSPRRRGG
jgi:hypothetical protein